MDTQYAFTFLRNRIQTCILCAYSILSSTGLLAMTYVSQNGRFGFTYFYCPSQKMKCRNLFNLGRDRCDKISVILIVFFILFCDFNNSFKNGRSEKIDTPAAFENKLSSLITILSILSFFYYAFFRSLTVSSGVNKQRQES